MALLTKKKFSDALVGEKILSRQDLKKLEEEAKLTSRSLDELLVEKKFFSPERLVEFRAKLIGVPRADLKGLIDPGAFDLLSESMIRKLGALPFKKEGRRLMVAMVDPEDLEAISFIEKRTRLKVTPLFTFSQEIEAAIGMVKSGAIGVGAAPEADIGSSVIRLVDMVIQNAIGAGSSDIHIEPEESEFLIRYRVDGRLQDVMRLAQNLAPAVIARVKVLANLKLDEHRLPQDGRFKKNVEARKFSFRVSVMPVFDGEKAALRILEEEAHIFSLEELGFYPDQREIIERNIARPFGMILATGPTGSGKTTTLYTLLQMLNKREVNIATVEDPIEYRVAGVNQTQVRPEIGLSFANGLRSLLRQDPNILMVGEIRDNETASLAIHAALTGHLVLSTLHTNNAAGALPRLLDMKAEGFLIASTASLIIAQRLVRRLCPDSKIVYKLTASEISDLKKSADLDRILEILRGRKIIPANADWPDITWYRPQSSATCPEGYKGRIAIAEVLEVTDRIRDLIVKGVSGDEIEKAAREEGMLTMQESGFLAAARGITSIEEILRVARE